tara:strand:+ start:2232 stop:2969 length:738 start_codon:yes stop_codon:yes gene_type:complete
MANFWRIVNKVISDADIVLQVIDARFLNETRNLEIEDKVADKGKVLITVVNKSDLVNKEQLEKHLRKAVRVVFVSSKDHHGFGILRERIQIEAKKLGWDRPRVGVLGYPNVGKSSVINALKGRASAKTSSESGYTKALQNVRAGNIILIDAPGVIPYEEKDKLKMAKVGSIDYGKIKEPDVIVMDIIAEQKGKIEAYFDVPVRRDKEETLEQIALKKKLVVKGGEPDIDRVSRMILKLWQTGKIR